MQMQYIMLICFCGFVYMEKKNKLSKTNEQGNARDAAAATGKNSHVVGGDTGEKIAEDQYDQKINSGLRSYIRGNRRYILYGFHHGGRRRRKSAAGLGFGLGGSGNDKAVFSGHGGDIGAESNSPRSGVGYGGKGGRGSERYGMFGSGRRKRATVGYFGVTGDVPEGLKPDFGSESEFSNGGRGFGKRRKRVTDGSEGGAGVLPGSFSTTFRRTFGIGGVGWFGGRRKRVVDGSGGDTGLTSGSLPSGIEIGGGMIRGRRRKRATEGTGVGKGGRSGNKPTGIEFGEGIFGGWRRKRATEVTGVGKGAVSDSLSTGVEYGGGVGGSWRRTRVDDGDRGITGGRQGGSRSRIGYGGYCGYSGLGSLGG